MMLMFRAGASGMMATNPFMPTACYSRLPVGWPILALDILQFPFDHPGLAFRVGQDIRQGEDTSPY